MIYLYLFGTCFHFIYVFMIIGNNNAIDAIPTIGNNTAFGPGSKAFGNISIGNHVFVASNSVVVSDIEDNSIVGGVPARFIKKNKY